MGSVVVFYCLALAKVIILGCGFKKTLFKPLKKVSGIQRKKSPDGDHPGFYRFTTNLLWEQQKGKESTNVAEGECRQTLMVL